MPGFRACQPRAGHLRLACSRSRSSPILVATVCEIFTPSVPDLWWPRPSLPQNGWHSPIGKRALAQAITLVTIASRCPSAPETVLDGLPPFRCLSWSWLSRSLQTATQFISSAGDSCREPLGPRGSIDIQGLRASASPALGCIITISSTRPPKLASAAWSCRKLCVRQDSRSSPPRKTSRSPRLPGTWHTDISCELERAKMRSGVFPMLCIGRVSRGNLVIRYASFPHFRVDALAPSANRAKLRLCASRTLQKPW